MLHLPDSFKTIAALAVGEYKDKGSKFIATALPVQTEEEVKAIYADFRKKYYDARHVCVITSYSIHYTKLYEMLRGVKKLDFKFTLTMAAYDLIKLPKLIGVAA